MVRVAIIGATGYTALELIKILLRHPEVEITALTSRNEGQPHVASVHPQLAGRLDLQMADLAPAEIAARAEVAFSCLPHGVTATLVPKLLEAGMRVVDLSADYRLNSADVYAEWYGQKHADPGRLGTRGLRAARVVSRTDSRGPAGGQPGLLSDVGDPAAGAA